MILKKIYIFSRFPLNFTSNPIHTHSLPQKKLEEEASLASAGVKRWGHGLALWSYCCRAIPPQIALGKVALAMEPVRQTLQMLVFPMLTLNLISHYMIFKPQRM